MGRKLELERSEIHTVGNTYDVVLRIDPDTGMVHSGINGKHVKGCTREEVLDRLQGIADDRDAIRYFCCYVLDPAADPLVVETYRIGTYEGCVGEDNLVNDPNLQWALVCSIHRHNRVMVGQIPRRWIIRPITKAADRELGQAITRLRTARQRLRDVEWNFDALTEQNPSSMVALCRANAEAQAED